MSLQAQEAFINWLDEMEKSKGWTDYRLSAETGLSSSVFSKARQGILPKWDALVRISKAFNISPVTAFRKAGLLPADGGDQSSFADWQFLLNKLPADEQEEIRQIVEMKIERRQKAEQAARAAKFKVEKSKK